MSNGPTTPAFAILYLLAAEAAAVMRILSQSVSSTVATRAVSLFVTSVNQNRVGLGPIMNAAGVPPLAYDLPMGTWSRPHAFAAWKLIEAVELALQGRYNCFLRDAAAYDTMVSATDTRAKLQSNPSALRAQFVNKASCLSHDADPFMNISDDIEALMKASPFSEDALKARANRTVQLLSSRSSTSATGTPATTTSDTSGQASGGSVEVTSLEPNIVTGREQQRLTAIPAAVWIIGAGVVVGGIGLLALRKMRGRS